MKFSQLLPRFCIGILLGIGSHAPAQCVLTANDDTYSEVEACFLAAAPSTEIQVPDNVTIEMAEEWDLSGLGDITLRIMGDDGGIEMSGSGVNKDFLILSTNSVVIIDDPNNTNALTHSGGGGNVRICFGGTGINCSGGTGYDGNDFTDIIAAGGVDANGVLPVDLVFFTGVAAENSVKLYWETVTEINNDYFEIYFSIDGINYELLDKVFGSGNSYEVIDYNYEHTTNLNGAVHYYLRQ